MTGTLLGTASAAVQLTLADLMPLQVELMLVASILVLLLVDLFTRSEASKRALSELTFWLLLGCLVLSFSSNTHGEAFFGAYVGNHWTLFLKRLFLVAGALAVLGISERLAKHQRRRQGEYFILLLASLLGMVLLPGARDLILLLVCFELMGLPLYVLAAYEKGAVGQGEAALSTAQHAPEASMKMYVTGAASSAVTLFGLSLVLSVGGTTRIDELARVGASPLLSVGMLLILAGMGFKIGAAPFHMWVPDTYQGSSTPFVAFLSVAPKVAGFVALVAVFFGAFSAHHEKWASALVLLSLLSMLVGNLMALRQTSVKRLLAYSGVSHIGYMLLAFIPGTPASLGMLLFYAAAYVVTNMGAFLVVEAVVPHGESDDLRAFDGLAQRAPFLAMAMLLFLLSLAGIPFVVGFWAKLYVFIVAWQAGYAWLVIVGAVLAVVALFYYLQIARAMYMVRGQSTPLRAAPVARLAIGVCLVAVVLFGAWPSLLLNQAESAASLRASVPVATLGS